MAIKTAGISPDESKEAQLQEYVMEVGSEYQGSSVEAVERFVTHLENKRVVDLGCGDGAATESFAKYDVKVIGIDINQAKLDNNPTATVCQDIVSWLTEQKDNSVPNIFTHHALEHLPNPQDAIDLIGRKLAKGGYFYAEVPANDSVHSVHHASFSSPDDLVPPELEVIDKDTTDAHYLIARKP